MQEKKIKHLEYFLVFILALIGIIGYFFSDYTSAGGGYYPNIYFLVLAVMYLITTFVLLLGNFRADFLGFIVVSPLSILIVEFILNGYQMLNIYPIFFLVIILLVSAKVQLRRNFLFLGNILPILVFYLYALISILVSIMVTGNLSDNSIYWFLIIGPLIIFIISLLVYSFQNSNINKRYIINYIYIIYVTLSLLMLGRIIYYFLMYSTSFDGIFKRIFSFPSMSTSNYTFGIIAILFLYICSNKELVSLRAIRISSVLFVIATLLSQSRGGLMALAGVVGFILIENIICSSRRKQTRIKTKNLLFSIMIVTFLSAICLLFKEKLIDVLSNINIVQRVELILSGSDNNIDSRMGYWKAYWDDYKDGNFLTMLFGNGLSNSINEIIRRPHNIYILVLNQLGIVGLIGFIACCLRILFKMKRLKYVVLYLMLHSLVEPLFLTVWIDTLFILLIFIESLSINISKNSTADIYSKKN
ncbi:O-antigen ligase family protein [Bacillus mycoides]|uniref:O-antigen ligase family protein n=1 Tax=Bacillus mycoides TaxID=1405 RepID=UPI003D1A23E8